MWSHPPCLAIRFVNKDLDLQSISFCGEDAQVGEVWLVCSGCGAHSLILFAIRFLEVSMSLGYAGMIWTAGQSHQDRNAFFSLIN